MPNRFEVHRFKVAMFGDGKYTKHHAAMLRDDDAGRYVLYDAFAKKDMQCEALQASHDALRVALGEIFTHADTDDIDPERHLAKICDIAHDALAKAKEFANE